MMTVREHLKAAGYDPEAAWNADWLQHSRAGIMECDSVEIQTFTCRPSQHEGEMLGVRATAIVPFSDGYEHPYPGSDADDCDRDAATGKCRFSHSCVVEGGQA